MNKLLAMWLLCFSAQVFALEMEGVKLDDRAQVGNATLQLNGTGMRVKLFFKVYVAALYLSQKNHTASAVLADDGAKRLTMHMLREVSGDTLLEAFEQGMVANNTAAGLLAMEARSKEFAVIFRSTKAVVKGDSITIDYFPGEGTRVFINGVEKGRIAGADFNRALLKIWLGEDPVAEDLKKGLLGG